MEDIYIEIANFFQVQKELYNNQILLNNEIIDINQLPASDLADESINFNVLKGQDKLTAYYHQIKDCKKCILSGYLYTIRLFFPETSQLTVKSKIEKQ